MAEATLKSEPIVKALHAAFCRDAGRAEILQLAATKMRATGPPYASVYLYMIDKSGEALVLEAFDGRKTEHTSIPLCRGLCGKAVTERTDLNVTDVSAAPEYLACNVDTRSELIVLIRRNEDILGQVDIDSDVPNGFDGMEQAAVKEVADALAVLL